MIYGKSNDGQCQRKWKLAYIALFSHMQQIGLHSSPLI
jgi:hypothetical protein